MIAVGSAAAGQFGYIGLSSVAERLLHSSPIPVALAPRGFRAKGGKVGRVTLAYTGGKQSGALLGAAETVAGKLSAELRLASFAVQLSPPETARFRAEEAAVTAEWTANIRSAAQEALKAGGESRQQAAEPEFVIGHGRDWAEAFDDVEWRAGDLLMIGSSESGPIARVFLGSRATKIVRHSPVPVLIRPPRGREGAVPGVTTTPAVVAQTGAVAQSKKPIDGDSVTRIPVWPADRAG